MYIIALILGTFTVPVSGAWRVWYNFWSSTDKEKRNVGAIYKNSKKIEETEYRTSGWNSGLWETVGKELLFHAKKGDTFFLKTEATDNGIYNVNTCFEFLNIEH